jgi:glycosyltransferase involved in cell wall biosynthesis
MGCSLSNDELSRVATLSDVVYNDREALGLRAVEFVLQSIRHRPWGEPPDLLVVALWPLKHPTAPEPEIKRGKDYLIGYLGVMGPQDGVDHALRVLAELQRRRRDRHAVFIGAGDVWAEMQDLARELGLDGSVEFTGRIPDSQVFRILSSTDLCLARDPKNPLNDVSTMTKIGEYMAMGRAIVSCDLKEARVSAGDAAERTLSWEHSKRALLAAYERALN